jgi:putative DNA primase/helicase
VFTTPDDNTSSSQSLDAFLGQLHQVRRSGSGWLACCPAHKDRHRSLSVSCGSDGRVLVHCHAGCAIDQIVAAMGLPMAALYPRSDRPSRVGGRRASTRQTRYRIRMADGSHPDDVIEHVRVDYASNRKRMWWERNGRRNLGDISTIDMELYRVGELPPSEMGDPIVIVEGEKATDALRDRGISAVGTVTGASAVPGAAALRPLAARHVVLWPDADESGAGHMRRLAAALEGLAAGVRVVVPPEGASKGWDAADADTEQALRLIETAVPPKADSADSKAPTALLLPPPSAPMRVARRLVEERHLHTSGEMVLRTWRGGFRLWDGRSWPERDAASVRAEAYGFLENASYVADDEIVPWNPTRTKVANVLDALAAVTHLPATVDQPAWLGDGDFPDPHDLIVTANGILHVPSRRLLPHNPQLFVGHSVPYGYERDVAIPTRWLAFLNELWEGDTASIDLLQEMFGYVLSGDTGMQKILLLVGPPRAGKGVIANVLMRLLGSPNVGAPTLAGLLTNFGAQDLIGKVLAVVSDARLGPQTNVHALAERMLSISGEDAITIDRKYRDPWTGRLGVRFLLLTNELPRFTDVSGALARRFVVLVLRKSFYGRENPGLLRDLLPELPGVLNWALDGLDRLRDQGRFTQPESARDAMQDLEDLASPVSAFLRDKCVTGPNRRVPIQTIWDAWRAWCDVQSSHHGTKQTFGRDLSAAVPGLRRVRPRDDDGQRGYVYEGVGLAN